MSVVASVALVALPVSGQLLLTVGLLVTYWAVMMLVIDDQSLGRGQMMITKTKSMNHLHWADSIQHGDDILEFAVSGDSAPNRRFNYRYDKGL